MCIRIKYLYYYEVEMTLPKPYYQDNHGKIYNMDAIELMKSLDNNSIDMIFTDPPFGHKNNDGDLISVREEALGQGKSPDEARQEIGQEIEGVSAAKQTFLLAQKFGIDMPITEQTYKVLYEGLAPREAVQNLLAREQKAES